MVERLNELLDCLETENTKTESSKSDKRLRSDLSIDINEILALDLDEPSMKPASKEPVKREKIKCYPTYIGGTSFPVGCSNLVTSRTCSALHCRNCDFLISHFPNYEWAENVEYLFLRTNMPNFQKVSQKLKGKTGAVAYACHCASFSTEKLQALHEIDNLPWFCRGHT